MFNEVSDILQSLQSPELRALSDCYLGDKVLMRKFRDAPAAMTLHHAFIGGLLEHTLQLLKIANATLPLYPDLNRDLVLMGLFLHDLGKCYELDWTRGFDYTTHGNLVGHVVFGVQMLGMKIQELKAKQGIAIPAAVKHCLEHIILSHHGKKEYGAPVLPSTPEAIFVAQVDNLDAKTTMGLAAADRSHLKPGQTFSERIWALETKIYRPDPLNPVTD